MSSQRNRNARGPSRNGGGEEHQLWHQAFEELKAIPDMVNEGSDNVRKIVAQESFMDKSSDASNMEAEQRKEDDLLRFGVKNADATAEQLKSVIDKLMVLRAIQKNKEEEAENKASLAASSRSGGLSANPVRNTSRAASAREREKERDRDREREKDPYDFDNTADSPVPSPIGPAHRGKLGGGGSTAAGSDRSGNRDSVPPSRGGDRDTPAKADSVEPQPGPGAGAAQRSKITFVKGQDVVFKPKPGNANETTDWFLGKVQQVLGEGKSRRYKVKDEDPDLPADQRPEYRTSASSMIPLPPVGAELAELEKGRTVLALYPDSTTFYKAEVMGTDKDTGRVNLRFEGEETSGTLQLVERRFVVEYRN
jgi:SAGA-associated factor 29